MGFATVLAVLAFGIALVALWLTSDIVKKVEGQNEKFVRAHIASLREEIRDIEKALNKTTRKTSGQEETQALLEKRLNDHTKTMDKLRGHISALNTQLEDLDRSIPPRYRVRVAKTEAKDNPPSIQ